MVKTSDLQPFLSHKPIVLIVEDRITKEYLIKAWGADEQFFNILAAGSKRTVEGVVEDLRKHGHTTVFGLVDRDFGESNASRWSAVFDPPSLFRPSFHEIENLLLDWEALAGCDLNQQRKTPRTADFIEEQATQEAKKQPWWLACRECLFKRQQPLCQTFPQTPKLLDMIDFQPAFDHIASSPWQLGLAARTTEILDQASLETDLKDAHQRYDGQLNDGQWVHNYSGKEIFRDLLSRVHDVRRSAANEPDVDLAKSVANWQRENARVPAEIDLLRSVLKRRVGI